MSSRSAPATTHPFHVGVCGTTERTVQCVQALANSPHFVIDWVVTPPPKPQGRQQELTPSPLHTWANLQQIPVWTVHKRLKEIQATLIAQQNIQPIDFLLVVDFGYLIPKWLLELPRLAPINIHPSALPAYRGSSPGQFALLYQETMSSVTIMRMDEGMDTGPVLEQLPLPLAEPLTAEQYYQRAFALAAAHLPPVLLGYSQTRQEIPQPVDSPTPLARRLERQDGFVSWQAIQAALAPLATTSTAPSAQAFLNDLSPLLQERTQNTPGLPLASLLEAASRALFPWPGLWTRLPAYKGRSEVRCKILATQLENESLVITSWQIDGEPVKSGRFSL